MKFSEVDQRLEGILRLSSRLEEFFFYYDWFSRKFPRNCHSGMGLFFCESAPGSLMYQKRRKHEHEQLSEVWTAKMLPCLACEKIFVIHFKASYREFTSSPSHFLESAQQQCFVKVMIN